MILAWASPFKLPLPLSASFDYLCYGSMAIIILNSSSQNIKSILVLLGLMSLILNVQCGTYFTFRINCCQVSDLKVNENDLIL